ncbi:MAG: metal-dependent hydrolase [Armatimonadota bacterium]|nr:metal-dependent hydrolase [bacterium]MDW8320300.1 metal-dependent hydrolase [Armatimonadota bacterium]
MASIHPALQITWLGHSGFFIRTPAGTHIAIDPWLSNPLCPDSARQLPKLDVLLLTHGHGDHIGDAVSLAKRFNPQVVAIYELASYLSAQGVSNTIGMNKGGTVKVAGLEVTMVHAVHSSAHVGDDGQILYLGDPAGFVVKCEDGFTFYHAGDTAVFSDMQLIGQIYRPELAMLPIGGLFTMDPREAAVAVRLLGVKKVIPMHYRTFPPLTGTPDELRVLTRDIEALEVIELQPGVTVE